MSTTPSRNEISWPWSYLQWPTQLAESFYNAPQHLQQSILPWTFGALVVNETNSSNPAAERAIVRKKSYGRQLGRISDAIEFLIKQTGAKDDLPLFGESHSRGNYAASPC